MAIPANSTRPLFLLAIPLFWGPAAWARPAASTIAASSCAQTLVQTAINQAADGDTVAIPGGSCNWSSQVLIPNTKGITLNGGGAVISGQLVLEQNDRTSSRVTGFNFLSIDALIVGGTKTSAPFRIDHSSFTVTSGGSIMLYLYGNAPGLIDHNSFNAPTNSEMIHNMGMGAEDSSGWSDDVVGGSWQAVYIEDNTFTNNNVSGNPAYFWGNSAIQSYYGARTVFRYNRLFMSQVDQHGTGGMIGARWWEIYENTFDTNIPYANQCCFIVLRAGSGAVFNNRHTGANQGSGSIDLYEEDTGYPALYQVGRGKNQVSDPAYVWGNGADIPVGSQTPQMVQPNRDYYLSPKPNYTPFTYPYPLTATGLPNPIGTDNVPPASPKNLRR